MATEQITLGGGCFWCLDGAFRRVKGVLDVESGYAGGHVLSPTYQQICTGNTGHAEVVKVTFDNAQINLEQILLLFFDLHDPTTLNRQGADVGSQYRSVIFYDDEGQKEMAERVIQDLSEKQLWPGKIVTQLKPSHNYFPAETYHQDYVAANPNTSYCQIVVNPKLKKFFASQAHLLK